MLHRGEVHVRMSIHATSLTEPRAHTLRRRIRWIVAATIAYNLVEAIVAITAGSIASSGALIAFGLDSTIEVLSAAAVAWQFTRRDPERWEKPTLVLFSDSDPIFSTTAAERMASRIPGAGPAEFIRGAGHFLQEEKGEEIAARVVRFLAKPS